MAILIVVMILFGGSKLPQFAKGLGQSIKEFKKASKEEDDTKPVATDAKASTDAKKPETTATHGSN